MNFVLFTNTVIEQYLAPSQGVVQEGHYCAPLMGTELEIGEQYRSQGDPRPCLLGQQKGR